MEHDHETFGDSAMATAVPELSDEAREAWRRFTSNDDNRGHVDRKGGSIDEEFKQGVQSARETVGLVSEYVRDTSPRTIIEIGASTGTNCIALQNRFPEAEVTGVEPEMEAINVAQKVGACMPAESRPKFIQGVVEELPFPDKSVDVVFCNTVIEHVFDVEAAIREIGRVLRPGGIAWLAAPNYVWPREPHLKIWCIPLLGKRVMKLAALIQGKNHQIGFLDHLQLVTPRRIEAAFRRSGLLYTNYMETKVRSLLMGGVDVKAYRRLSGLLRSLDRVGAANTVIRLALATGMYPSLLYIATRKSD